MASLAIVKAGFAESALTVVAGHTSLRARVGEMLRRESRTDLASLRQSASRDYVATLAVEPLAQAVIHVAEADAERARLRGGSRVASGSMTDAAGGDINSTGLPAGSVTLITGLVRAESGGNGFGYAAARWGMTGGTALLRPRLRQSGCVLRVVKLRVEASEGRKLFKRWILLAETFRPVADRAQRTVGRGELRLVAADTVFVLRESRL